MVVYFLSVAYVESLDKKEHVESQKYHPKNALVNTASYCIYLGSQRISVIIWDLSDTEESDSSQLAVSDCAFHLTGEDEIPAYSYTSPRTIADFLKQLRLS